jgi:enoyl-[acyl-carrier protein] reductase II
MKTALTELLGIECPLLLPGMSWISKPELVAGVSEAGGLGILATGPLDADQTRASIREVRERTNKPFGIGVTLMMPGSGPNARVALEEKVPVINYQLGRGQSLIDGVHAYGGKAITTVTSVKHAVSAERAGADAVLVTGHEAAAHGEEVTSLVLVPSVARAVEIPVVAAGGFASGGGLVAALALGASGVAMGTRLASTIESGLHPAMKKVIVEKTEEETIYTKNFDGMWARVMRTPTSERITAKPMSFLETAVRAVRAGRAMGMPIRPILTRMLKAPNQVRLLSYFGAAIPLVESATVDGDAENGVQFIGQSQGLVDDVPSVAELVPRIIAEAEQILVDLNDASAR